jgi:hypothetical protein
MGAGRFVDVETDDGHSMSLGQWLQRSMAIGAGGSAI